MTMPKIVAEILQHTILISKYYKAISYEVDLVCNIETVSLSMNEVGK